MRDFTEQLKQFETVTENVRHYSLEANEFLKTIEPVAGEVVVYRDFTYLDTYHSALPKAVFASPSVALCSAMYTSLRGKGVCYQQGKPAYPIITESRLFAHQYVHACESPLWRCLAPADSEFVAECRIPSERLAAAAWKERKLITVGGVQYVRKHVALCDSITVLNFMGDLKRELY